MVFIHGVVQLDEYSKPNWSDFRKIGFVKPVSVQRPDRDERTLRRSYDATRVGLTRSLDKK